ncbi:hypothetical protein [Pseudomonas mosselii]|uniref:hypothetical protein n=1 Tax=Pseudomonas mosselii TaxID=78327 RepID=UPI0027DE3575|nr:hypothetical protein [Pseudomonas mosselii]
MPTENRSSNTEMVSVPRDIIEFAVGFKTHGYKNLTEQHTDQRHAQDKLRAILAQPTQQHQGEPVGYQQRTMTDRPGSQWTPWRECCDATRARYSQEVGQINQHGIMREIRPVFASAADPGEVERLPTRSYR